MNLTVVRRSERIRNRNSDSVHLHQKKTQGSDVAATVRCKKRRRHKQTTSQPDTTLPDELLIHILSRLPPKPFFRCRSVCKSWLSLFSDAAQVNKHLKPNQIGFFYNSIGDVPALVNLSCGTDKVEVDETFSTLPCHRHGSGIQSCCNGLLLLEASVRKSTLSHMYVYNPITRTMFTLNYIFSSQTGIYAFSTTFSLAFDPQMYPQFHVIVFSIGRGNISQAEIFLFERGDCRHHKKLVLNTGLGDSNDAFVDGRLYHTTDEFEILSIDPNKCSYQLIQPPKSKVLFMEIGQSQGCLHYMCGDLNKMLSIWVLESYSKQEWTLKYQVSLLQIYNSLPDSQFVVTYHFIKRFSMYGHLKIHPEKDIIFMPLGRENFLALDLSTGIQNKLGCLSQNVDRDYWVYMPRYFVPLGH